MDSSEQYETSWFHASSILPLSLSSPPPPLICCFPQTKISFQLSSSNFKNLKGEKVLPHDFCPREPGSGLVSGQVRLRPQEAVCFSFEALEVRLIVIVKLPKAKGTSSSHCLPI